MFSRIGFRAIMAPAFLVWSLYFLFLALRKNGYSMPLLSGLLFGLGFHSYIAYRAAPLLLIPVFIIFLKNKKFKPLIIFCLGAFIAVLPLLIFFAQNPQDFLGRTSQISIFSLESPVLELGKNILLTIGMFFIHGDGNWRHNFAGAPELWWPVAILFLLGSILSLRKIFKIENIFLWLWIIVMALPVVISSEGLPHALRAIIIIPPVMILAALGLDWIIEKIKKWLDLQISKHPESTNQLGRIKKELMLLVFILMITIGIHSYNLYFQKWAYNPNVYWAFSENYAEIGSYLNQAPQNLNKYVIINADGVEVRGVSMPSQTVMFITNTFLPENQQTKNIYYITRPEIDNFIEKIKTEENFEIIMLETDSDLRQKISSAVPEIKTYQDSGVLIQGK